MQSFLKTFQAEAYATLASWSEQAFFLHSCRQSHALWLSDLPKFLQETALNSALRSLASHGFVCELDLSAGLLWIDLSRSQYEAMLAMLPRHLPPLPRDDALHPAYALCRLLLFHPSSLSMQPLSSLRNVLKELDQASGLLRLIPRLHEECSMLLRAGRPLPHAVGPVLCAWLKEQET